MITTYVISLEKEEKRKNSIINQCQIFNIFPHFINAIDARNFSQKEIENLSSFPLHKKKKKQRWMSKGELGCALSHHLAYQTFLKSNEDFALILEDDAIFIKNPSPLLQKENLDKIKQEYDFDILILGHVKTLASQLPYYYRRIPIKYRAQLKTSTEILRFGTPWEQYGCGAVAYIITKQGAKKMLPITQKPQAVADDWLYFEKEHHLKILHIRPAFVLENLQQLPSTIRQEKADFLHHKTSSIIVRSIKGHLKNFAMNQLGIKK